MKKLVKFVIFLNLIFSFGFPLSSFVYASSIVVTDGDSEINSSDLKLYTDCILLVEKETGDILYEKNSSAKMYPASTTKMLTAILVLENSYLNELVTVSSTALNAVPATYTTANLQAGEQFRVEDLLYAMLIPSANDAANVLAEHISGSITAFADLMNKKATEIGLTSSHFTNPSGIHDENLYTTAYDLSLIARYAMRNEKFREIVKTTSFTLPATPIHPKEDRILHNSNLLLDSSYKEYYYEYATGIKTGFTTPAGDCLVASSKKDDIEFIVVCLHSNSLENGLREKFLDCKTLFDFAFDNYTTHYKNLQDKSKENILEASNNSIQSIDMNEVNNKFSFPRFLLKVASVIIILFAVKILFFRKKKNRRRKFKRH